VFISVLVKKFAWEEIAEHEANRVADFDERATGDLVPPRQYPTI
jgi:hypothetical protein